MTTQTTTRRESFRLIATHIEGGAETVLARARSLKALTRRIAKDGDFWHRIGWELVAVEDNGLGFYSEMLLEDLRGRLARREITRDEFRDFEWLTMR